MADDQKDYTQAEFIDDADRLQMENFHLQLQNLQLQKQLAETAADSLGARMAQVQAAAVEYRKRLDAKYGMPITPMAIDKTGRLMRPKAPLPDLPVSIAAPKEN